MFFPDRKRPAFDEANRRNGFALVISLSLMSLVLILLVILAGQVRIELQARTNERNEALLRENVFIAMAEALGGLQKTLGPDQRISVRSDFLEESIANPHWTGVYRQADGYNPRVPDTTFVKWLISSPTESGTTDEANADFDGGRTQDETAENWVHIWKPDPAEPAGWVAAPTVSLPDSDRTFAWWIGDEGGKARIGKGRMDRPGERNPGGTSPSRYCRDS